MKYSRALQNERREREGPGGEGPSHEALGRPDLRSGEPACALLQRLNDHSLTRSFTPGTDIDWEAGTTDAEYESLYSAWSLLVGSGLDAGLDAENRATFVKYQQINIMMFTALLERYGIAALVRLDNLDAEPAFSEYIGHFIKEEAYHHTMFLRAAGRIQESLPGRPPLPFRSTDTLMRWLFRILSAVPVRKVRSAMTFTVFRFAERITIHAQRVVEERIPRPESLIRQIWTLHALDESRHLAFDALVLDRNRLPGALARLPLWLVTPLCLALSLRLNANELWIAREVGVRAPLWRLPALMRRTRAPFKREVFALLRRTIRGDDAPRA